MARMSRTQKTASLKVLSSPQPQPQPHPKGTGGDQEFLRMPCLTPELKSDFLYQSPAMWVIMGRPVVQDWTASVRDNSPVFVVPV